MDSSKGYNHKNAYPRIKPSKIIINLNRLIRYGDVLDIGVGEGKNAVFLAKKGFNVEGLDISDKILKRTNELAKINKVAIKTHCIDIRNFKFKKKYNLIISTFTLHYLPKKNSYIAINKMKNFTKEGGLNLITVFTRDVPDYSPKLEKKFKLNLFKKDELKNLYSNWDIIKYSEETKLDKSHGKPHYHKIALLIAKKRRK